MGHGRKRTKGHPSAAVWGSRLHAKRFAQVRTVSAEKHCTRRRVQSVIKVNVIQFRKLDKCDLEVIGSIP